MSIIHSSTIKMALLLALLSFNVCALGQDQPNTEYCLKYGPSKVEYFVKAKNRLFVEKDSTISQDYITSLLNRLTDSNIEISWISQTSPRNNLCRVVYEDSLIDNLITELIKDDAIITARRIYITRSTYEYVLNHPEVEENVNPFLKYPYSQRHETFFFNNIVCFPETQIAPAIIDSICSALCLSIKHDENYDVPPYVFVSSSKSFDIFEVSNKLYDTGYFLYVHPDQFMPYYVYGQTIISPSSSEAHDESYYNLSGEVKDSPSGLTIVVTRYSDGSVKTEKKLFK